MFEAVGFPLEKISNFKLLTAPGNLLCCQFCEMTTVEFRGLLKLAHESGFDTHLVDLVVFFGKLSRPSTEAWLL